MGPLWRELPASRPLFFYTSLGFPNMQGLMINQNLTFLSKSTVKQHLLPGPPTRLLRRKTPYSRACKGPSPPPFSFPVQSPHRQKRSVSRALFYCLSKFPVNKRSFSFLTGTPMVGNTPLQSFPLNIVQGLHARSPPSRFPRRAPIYRVAEKSPYTQKIRTSDSI